MMVLPGHGSSFEDFQADNALCRGYADQQIGGVTAQQALDESTARSAVTTALLGAAIGAAVDGGHGAGIGAATGALLGTAAGSGIGAESAVETQRRYDFAYAQCMYARGHQVPVPGVWRYRGSRAYASPPPPRASSAVRVPPPPPGRPPPPPPGAE